MAVSRGKPSLVAGSIEIRMANSNVPPLDDGDGQHKHMEASDPTRGEPLVGATVTSTQAAESFGASVIVATGNDGDGQHALDVVDIVGRSCKEAKVGIGVDVVGSPTKRPRA